MKIITLKSIEEKKHTRKLYEEAFSSDPVTFVDYYYSEKIKDNQILVIYRDEEIVSMLHLNPYYIYFNRSIKKIYFTVAIATQSNYRSRGYATYLIKDALQKQFNERCPLSFLIPLNESFYYSIDYCSVYKQNIDYYTENQESNSEMTYRIEDFVGDRRSVFAFDIERQLNECFQLFVLHDQYYYERFVKEIGSVGGMLMITTHNSQIQRISQYYPDVNISLIERRNVMIRIVDLYSLLETLFFYDAVHFQFNIIDNIISDNSGLYRIDVDNENNYAKIHKMPFDCGKCKDCITIRTFTKILFDLNSTACNVALSNNEYMSEELKQNLSKMISIHKIRFDETV